MSDIFVFSGLGVDERVFREIDFGNHNVHFIHWTEPLQNESMQEYTFRISQQITSENPIFIGLSFGGMIAVELSKFIKTKQVILLASAKTKNELPFYFRIVGKPRINTIIPSSLLKFHTPFSDWFFGIGNREDSKLLKQILKDTSPEFLKWAIDKILHWSNETFPENYIHIHGEKDRVIPIKSVKYDYSIKNAGHFLTVTHFEEVNEILEKILNFNNDRLLRH